MHRWSQRIRKKIHDGDSHKRVHKDHIAEKGPIAETL